MILYTSDGCKYEGMSEETIVALRADLGKLTAFITLEEHNAIMAAIRLSRGE